MSKYKAIADGLRHRISNQEFKATMKLPSEDELIEQYKVSRNTIRSAIQALSRVGFIYPVQGSGYYIHEVQEPCTYMGGTKGLSFDHPGRKLTTKLISLTVETCDAKLSKLMKCEIGALVYHFIRVRFSDNQPLCIEDTYYLKSVVPYLGKEICEQSVYSYIQNDLGINFGLTDKYVSCDIFTKEQSEILGISEGRPCLIIEDRAYTTSGILFNASKTYYVHDKAKFFLVVQ